MNAEHLEKFIRQTFNLTDTDDITQDQLNYALTMLKPSNYILNNHKIKGKPITFSVPDYDTNRALAHRPWQIGILNDMSKRVSIIKSRQLGLSELGIEQMIYFLDTHSYDRVNGLYTFPTYRQLQDFFKQRIRPEFDSGYYATLVDPKQISMNQMKIRDSTLVMRSSSQGSSMEGLQIDLLSLDEYDRLNPLAESSAINNSVA